MGRKKLTGGRVRTTFSLPTDVHNSMAEYVGNVSAKISELWEREFMGHHALDAMLAEADKELAKMDAQIESLIKAREEREARFVREAGGQRIDIRVMREQERQRVAVQMGSEKWLAGWQLIEKTWRREGKAGIHSNKRLLEPYGLDVNEAVWMLKIGKKPEMAIAIER
jgi:hypothetical protein